MRFTNTTPFPTLCFETKGPGGTDIHTVVVRATTTIIPGAPLFLADEQLPLKLTDCYYGKPGSSSLKYPSDLVPFKPKTDIIIIGSAYPPAKGSLSWRIAVTVGQHKKSLLVLGECFWKKGFLLGWHVSPVTPVSTVAICYENAYGGALVFPDDQDGPRIVDLCKKNPVGKGWISPLASKLLGKLERCPMPQIFSTNTSLRYGEEHLVEGFGAIAPDWAFRQRYRGRWRVEEDEVAIPFSSDFDFLYYNSAHPDLIVPYLKGDEAVQLLRLTPGGKLDFTLPGHLVYLRAKYARQEELQTIPALLDTLIIEPDEMRASLVWRSTVTVDPDLESLEARLIFQEGEGDHE